MIVKKLLLEKIQKRVVHFRLRLVRDQLALNLPDRTDQPLLGAEPATIKDSVNNGHRNQGYNRFRYQIAEQALSRSRALRYRINTNECQSTGDGNRQEAEQPLRCIIVVRLHAFEVQSTE